MDTSLTDKLKQQAADLAVTFVESGMVVGLGEGSTAILALYKIGQLIKTGELKNIIGIPSSLNIEKAANKSGIPLSDLNHHNSIDITIDGADEVDSNLNLIKGGGGALLREKMIAQISQREIIIVDESKMSTYLGEKWSLPIEVVQFGWKSHFKFFKNLGGIPKRRISGAGIPFITDQGNYIIDVDFGKIKKTTTLSVQLNERSGIVEHGMFIDLATDVLVAKLGGIKHLKKFLTN